jgi:hypothetical protein
MNLFGDYSSVGTRDEHMLTHSFLEVITYWPKSNKAGDLAHDMFQKCSAMEAPALFARIGWSLNWQPPSNRL